MTDNTNIREKSRAVFLAALMVVSVFAMSASFAGTAAAQNVDETTIDSFSIDDKQVLTGPPDATRNTSNFSAGGINFGTAQNPSKVTQTHVATLNVSEGDNQELVVDISESVDAGVGVDIDNSTVSTTSGDITNLNIDAAGSELVVTFDATSDAELVDITINPVLTNEEISSSVVTGSFEHEAQLSSGDSASASYRLTNTGQINIGEGDGSELLGDQVPPTNFTGTGSDDAWDVWAGSVISTQTGSASGDTMTVAVFEAETNDTGALQKGDRVSFKGTSPANTTAIDTGTLDSNGEYLIELDGDETDLIYIDLQEVGLDASVDEEITIDNPVEVDITSNDIGQSDALAGDSQSVQAIIYEAGDDPTAENVVDTKTGTFDGDGTETIEFNASDDADLTGTGDYYAVARHVESQNTASTDTVSVVEPLDKEVTIVKPRQTDDAYTRGDIIDFELDLQGTDTATLTFGDRAAGQNVEVNVTVQTDEVGGTANFLLNTFEIGDGPVQNDSDVPNPKVGDTGVSVSNWGDEQHGVITETDDSTTLVDVEAHDNIRIGGGSNDEASRKVVIADGSYDLTASPDETAYTADGAIATDNSIVRIDQRPGADIQAWNAPTPGDDAAIADIEFADAEDSSVFDIEAAIEQGLISPQDNVTAKNDILVLQAQVAGLEGLLASQSSDVEDFLNREDDHYVTSAFDNQLLSLDTNQSTAQVEEIVSEVRAERASERNLPQDNTFGASAILDLSEQEVLAGTNDRDGDTRDNLNEYFITVPLEDANIDDNRTSGDDIGGKLDDLDDADRLAPDLSEDLINTDDATSDNEVPTAQVDERDVVFNTEFNLSASRITADDFPENGLFGGDITETVSWELVDDTVELNDVEETEDGPRLLVPAQNDYTIEGTTEIAAGTTMTSQTRTASGEDPAFFYPNEFAVDYVENGPNTISFSEDFLNNDQIAEGEDFAGSDFRVTIRRARQAGNLLEDADRRGLPGTIEEITEVNAHTFNDQETAGATVTVAEVNVSSSATVEIRDADGNVLGSEEVPEGLSEDVRVVFDENIEDNQELTSVLLDEDGTEFQEGPSSQTAQITVAGSEPLYVVNDLDPQDATAAPGDTLDISATVTNRGGAGDGSGQTVELVVGGSVVDSQTVTVAEGETQTVTFSGVTVPDVEEETTVEHAIRTADDSDEGTLTISPPDPAFFEITEFSPQSATVSPGDEVEATVTVENTGDVEGTQTVTLSADNGLGELGSQEVTLGPGESASESFTFTVPEVDSTTEVTHTLATDDDEVSGTLTIEVEQQPQDDSSEDDTGTEDDTGSEDTGGDDGGSSDDGGPGFGIAAALVAIIGAALLAYRRQQN